MESGRKDGKAARKEDNNPEDCPVCFMVFNNTVQRPHTLPCGHTFCTVCINGLMERDEVTCPTCRGKHAVPQTGNFPISYTLEAVVKKMRDAALASASSPPCAGKGTSKAGTPGHKLSRKFQSFLEEQQAKGMAAITVCEELQSQLRHYRTTLVAWHDQQQQFEDKLQAVIDESRNARELVRQEEAKVASKEEEVQQGDKQLHEVLETLRRVFKEQEAGVAAVDVVRCTGEAEQRMEECREMFPDVHTVTTARKAMVVSRAAVTAAEALKGDAAAAAAAAAADDDDDDDDDDGAADDDDDDDDDDGADADGAATDDDDAAAGTREFSFPTDPTSTLAERFQALLTQTLEAKDLRTLTQTTWTLLQAGLVFASHKAEGQTRHARITLEDGRLYLHSLQEHTLPLCAATLQVKEVVPAAPPPCLVFLDLAWPGSAPRRVFIRLSPDTPMGRQFVLMCTGQRGPSYVNTKLLQVVHKGQPGERVYGGDYETKDGKGGAALLPDLDKCEYRKSGQAGAVFWVYWPSIDKSDWNTRFGIRTKDRQDGGGGWVFGEVVEGLEVVAAAAKHIPIKEVTVVDCGVVLCE